VPLAPVDLVARVVARVAFPTVSAALTDWASTTPALAIGSRPVPSRTAARSASWMRSVIPSRFHRAKYQYTVSHGGKSCGSCRHEQPVRLTYRIASTMHRRGWSAARGPLRTGTMGSTSAHCSSVRFEG